MKNLTKIFPIFFIFLVSFMVFHFNPFNQNNTNVGKLEGISNPDNDLLSINEGVTEIRLLTPENIDYTEPMYGYYPGSCGFESDVVGSKPGWFETVGTLGGTVRVIPELDDHKKVLELRDTSPYIFFNARVMKKFSSSQSEGTIEYWMRTNNVSNVCGFRLDNGMNGLSIREMITLRTWAGKLQRFNGTHWLDEVCLQNDLWHHIRIDFDCTSGRWWLYVDLVLKSGFNGYKFINEENQASRAEWYTDSLYGQTDYYYYLDAIGLSWDPSYIVSNNCYEGLLVYFQVPSELSWIGYSLDGDPPQEIPGPFVLPMPNGNGPHQIQVFGKDIAGISYQSKPRSFIIEKPSLLLLHGMGGANENWEKFWINRIGYFGDQLDLDRNGISDVVDYYETKNIFYPHYYAGADSEPEFQSIVSTDVIPIAEAVKNYIINRVNTHEMKPNLDICGYSLGGLVIRTLIKNHYEELQAAGISIKHVGIFGGPCHGTWINGNEIWLSNPTIKNYNNQFASYGTLITRLDEDDETPNDIIYNTYAGINYNQGSIPGVDLSYGCITRCLEEYPNIIDCCPNCENIGCCFKCDWLKNWNLAEFQIEFNNLIDIVGTISDIAVPTKSVALEGARNNRVYSRENYTWICGSLSQDQEEKLYIYPYFFIGGFDHTRINNHYIIVQHGLWDLRRGNFKEIEEIEILSPQNVIYNRAMIGYYPSTYGFEEDIVGSKPSCFETINRLGGTVKVISEIDGHKNVVEFYDGSKFWFNNVIKELPNRPSFGTIEYWMRTNDSSKVCGFILDNGESQGIIALRTWNNNLQYWDNDSSTWYNIISIQKDEWYHIRVDFEASMGTYEGLMQYKWRIYINGVQFGDFDFASHEIEATRLVWYTDWLHSQQNYYYYIDAIGVSWDPAYEIGDNLKEGLVLTFQKTFLADKLEYSIDGNSKILIEGNRTIPMPVEGTHSIQVFGQTLYGKICQSPKVTFFAHHELHLDILQQLENGIETPPGAAFSAFDDLNITITYRTRIGPFIPTWTNISLYYKINEESWNGPYGLGFGEGIQTASFVLSESNYSKYDDVYYYFYFQQINDSQFLKDYYWTQDGIKFEELEAKVGAFHKLVYPIVLDLTLNYSLWFKAQAPTNMTTDQGNNVTIYPMKDLGYESIALNFYNTTTDEMNYSVSCINQPFLAHSIDGLTSNISKDDNPVFTLNQGVKSPFILARNIQYTTQVSTILIPEILFNSVESSRNLVFTGELLNLTYLGIENWPSTYRTAYKFASNNTLIRFDTYTGIMVYLEHIYNEENASQKLIWGLMENSLYLPNTLDIAPRCEIIDEGTIVIPDYLLTIVHDPPGDHSYGKVETGTSTYIGLDLNLSAEMALYLDKKFLGAQVGDDVYLVIISVESESYDGELTLTYAKDLSSCQETESAALIGPGRGDLYYGVNLVVQYYIKMTNYYIVVGDPDKPNIPQNDIKVWQNGSKLEYKLNYSSEFNIFGANLETFNKTQLIEQNVFADNIISVMEASMVEECPNSPLFWSPDMPVNLYYPTIAQPNTIIDLNFKFTPEKFFTWCQEGMREIFNPLINATTGEIEMSLELFYNTTGSSATRENRQITCHLEDNDGMPIGEHDQFYMEIYRDLRFNTYGYIVYEDFTYTSRPYEIGTRDRRSPAGFMFLNLGEYIHGTDILTCSAVDEETGVKCIEFYYDDDQNFGSDSILIGYQENCTIASPNLYEISWNTTNLGGTYYLFAVTYDNADPFSNSLVSKAYAVKVDNNLPTLCEIDAHEPFSHRILLYARTFDADSGIEYVEYWDGDPMDPNSKLLGISYDSYNSFQFAWATDPEGSEDGLHLIYARAFDKAGNSLLSESFEIKVDQSSGKIDLTPIWISILIGTIAVALAILLLGFLRRTRPGTTPLPPKGPNKFVETLKKIPAVFKKVKIRGRKAPQNSSELKTTPKQDNGAQKETPSNSVEKDNSMRNPTKKGSPKPKEAT